MDFHLFPPVNAAAGNLPENFVSASVISSRDDSIINREEKPVSDIGVR